MKEHCPECVGLTGEAHIECMEKNCPQLLEVELAKKKKKKKGYRANASFITKERLTNRAI